MNGVSLLLIERSMPGVTTRQMQCSGMQLAALFFFFFWCNTDLTACSFFTGVWASGTSYITFEDVKVPVENLVGKENKGFKVRSNDLFPFRHI